MSFTFNCPKCGQEIEAEEEWIGQEANCPSCKTLIEITQPSTKQNRKSAKTKKNIPPQDEEPSQQEIESPKQVKKSTKTKKNPAQPNKDSANQDEKQAQQAKKAPQPKKNTTKQAKDSANEEEETTKQSEPSNTESDSEESTHRRSSSRKKAQKKNEEGKKSSSKQSSDTAGTLIQLLLAAGLVWLIVAFLKNYPRISFWTLSPVVGLILICTYEKMERFLVMMLCMGLVFWGWEVHHLHVSHRDSSPSHTTVGADYQKDSKITINVNVTKWLAVTYDSWKYNCEYKLYANDICIASKNSTSISVSFRVKVEKGADIRAEMLPKNGFGGTTSTLEGPRGTRATAVYDGQTIDIECY